jgi:hypothetical protein
MHKLHTVLRKGQSYRQSGIKPMQLAESDRHGNSKHTESRFLGTKQLARGNIARCTRP